MILSQFRLDTLNGAAARDLVSPYELHRTIWRLLGDNEALWRLEGQTVLLQSLSAPDWNRLPQGYLDSAPAQRSFEPGQLPLDGPLRFRLRANPTIKRRAAGKSQGKRHPILDSAGQLAWLERQAAKCGFSLLQAAVSQSGAVSFSRPDGGLITLQSSLYDGVLKVDSAPLFLSALGDGIGPAKAFGMGLLSLASV